MPSKALSTAVATTLIGLTASAATAASVALTASGTIDQLFNNTAGDLPSPLDNVAIGDAFTVEFTYFDDGAVDTQSIPNESAYVGQIDPNSYMVTIGGNVFDFVVDTAIGVVNDGGEEGVGGDTVTWGAQQSVDGTEAGRFSSGVALTDIDGTVFDSTDIPLGPFTLSDFEVAAFSINNIILDEFGVPTGESFSISGDIDFLEIASSTDSGDGDTDGDPGGGNEPGGNGDDDDDTGGGGVGGGGNDDDDDDLPDMDDDGDEGGGVGGGNGDGGDPAVIPVPAAAYSVLPLLGFLGYRKFRGKA